ncbi:MAG: thiamine-phosphate kinase, partial [Myxococcota bacterium]
SDGCVHDLRHLLEGSHVGARLNTAHIPVPDALRATSRALGVSLWDWVLAGGDDYALLATISPERMGQLWQLAREYDFTISDIGEVGTQEEGLELLDDEGNPMALEFEGYEHTLGLKETPT